MLLEFSVVFQDLAKTVEVEGQTVSVCVELLLVVITDDPSGHTQSVVMGLEVVEHLHKKFLVLHILTPPSF